MWIDSQGTLYFGDCAPGDRAATEAEIDAWQAAISAASVPEFVTRGQGREALLNAGKLVQVEALIVSIPDETERLRAQINYERETWERRNPFLQAMWAQLGGDEAGLDAIFIGAARL